jgi:deoxycytidine triphosphate deaminase
MEILEIVNYNIDLKSNILDVSFRTIEDSEDEQRVDRIDYSLVEEYGYDITVEDFDFFTDDDDEDEFDDDYNYEEDIIVDEEELISFLNEYYMVNPTSLPKATIY